MTNEFLCVTEAVDLALQSDSDDSLIENESDGDNHLLLSDNDVESRSDDGIDISGIEGIEWNRYLWNRYGIDISDEESSDPDVQSTSLATQRPCATQARTRNNNM